MSKFLDYAAKKYYEGTPVISDEEFDRLYELSTQESDLDKRIEIYQRLNEILFDDMPVIPLYYDQIVRFTHKNISGFRVNAQNNLDLSSVIKR